MGLDLSAGWAVLAEYAKDYGGFGDDLGPNGQLCYRLV